MPTYDYQCLDCDHHWEAFQRITEPRLSECPECRGRAKRLIGAGAGLIFKGSGFYTTDYRSKEYKEKQKSDRESSTAAKASSSPAKKDVSPSPAVSDSPSKANQ